MTFLVVTDWLDDKSFLLNAEHIVRMKQRHTKAEIFLSTSDSIYVKETTTEIMEALAKQTGVELAIPQMSLFDEGVRAVFAGTEKTSQEISAEIDAVAAIEKLEPIERERNV